MKHYKILSSLLFFFIYFSPVSFSTIFSGKVNFASAQDNRADTDDTYSISSFTDVRDVGRDSIFKKHDDDIISRIFRKEKNPPTNESALIRIRVVQINKSAASNSKSEEINDLYTSKLADVSRKLSGLPFKQFKLLSDENIIAPINQKQTLKIADNQTLVLKPLYFHNNKLCVRIDWKEPDGEQILDSQLHFNLGESIITGSESSEENGLLLILNAERK